jgi:Undecaprenyl-phosphate galactose phosphotransferase WbaP
MSDSSAAYQAGKPFGQRGTILRQRLVNLSLILTDILLAATVCGVAFSLQGVWGSGFPSEVTVTGIVPGVLAWIGLRALLGLYPGYGLNIAEELRRQTYAVLATLAIVTIFAVALQVGDLVSRLVLVLSFSGLLLAAPVMRQLTKCLIGKIGLWGKPVVILSSGEPGERIATLLDREWELGYIPVAVFGNQPVLAKRRFTATPDENSLAEALIVSKSCGIDTVIIAMPYTRKQVLIELINWASLAFEHVVIIPNLEGATNSAVMARDLSGVLGVEIRHNLLNPSSRRTKRVLDLIATAFGSVLVLPVLLVLSLLVWLESGRPVFYSAQRMGRDGRLFSCLKYRTMVSDAEAMLWRLMEDDPEIRREYSEYHKLRADPRVTRVGRFLRKTSLDELPQLWNVIKGEMSLVGPRPYLPRESSEIGVAQREILRVPPGITGPWQVSGRNDTSFGERVGIDAYYVRNWSVWLDLVILARTAKTLLLDRGAY